MFTEEKRSLLLVEHHAQRSVNRIKENRHRGNGAVATMP